jgi:hypothetical protein
VVEMKYRYMNVIFQYNVCVYAEDINATCAMGYH